MAKLYFNTIIGEFEPVEIVKRSLDSIKDHVDGLYVTITYKGENPKQDKLSGVINAYIAEYGGKLSFFKWTKNFAEARQFALEQVPTAKDTYVYWHDADDVLHGAERLKEAVATMQKNNAAAIYFDYWYQVDLDKNGNVREVLVKHPRERIILNDNTWKWIGELHETLIEQKQENVLKIADPAFDDVYVIHLTDNSRLDQNIARNVEILEETARKQQHKDPRTLIYLAKAYFDQAKMVEMPERKIKLDLALTFFHKYLAGSGTPGEAGYTEPSGWAEERSTAWGYIGEIAVLTGHPEVAIQAYQSAIDEAPWFPNYYVDMAMCYVMLNDFKKAEHWLNVSTSMPDPRTTIIQFPRELKSRSLEVSFQINMNKQKLEWAREDAEKMVKLMPNDPIAKQRLENVQSLWAYNRACQSVVFLGKYLEQVKEKDKIGKLLEAIPGEMHRERFVAEMKRMFNPPTIWGENDITILCGPGWEPWDPQSVKTGIGGSEEAVIYIAKELTKLGWHVTVYGNPPKPGNFEGVEYKIWHDINPKDQFNVLVLWRSIGFVDIDPQSKFTMLWLHDVPNNPDFTEERMAKVDKVAVLSDYHKSLLRVQKDGFFEKMPADKIFLTANGLPPRSVKPWNGNPKRLIYSSSPDRGLVYLLRNWDRVKKEVPEAELHIFYGWDVYDALHKDNPARLQWKNKILTMMNQDGIVNHGRVGHEALAYEFQKSGIWAYPTDFTEISCITAMKAQQLGAIPVVTDYAALSETVRNGLRVDVDITTEEGQKEYFDALIGLLKDPKQQEEIRKPMMKWAEHHFDWENVAKLWTERFRISLQNPQKRYELNTSTRQDRKDMDTSVRSGGQHVRSVQTSREDREQREGDGRSARDITSNGSIEEDRRDAVRRLTDVVSDGRGREAETPILAVTSRNKKRIGGAL